MAMLKLPALALVLRPKRRLIALPLRSAMDGMSG